MTITGISAKAEISSPPVPAQMRALVLDGVGFEHLQVRQVPTPRPGPHQMLARVDAAGICASLIKIAEQGPNHSLIHGWDVTRYPLILGDEGVVTLVEVGEALRGAYNPGERYVIQPAVSHPPVHHRERYRNGGRGVDRLGVGYTLGGFLAEYMLITEEVLAAGCLIPLPDPDIPHAHAALSEPFSCVISAQDRHVHLVQASPTAPREVVRGLKPGGVTVIVGAGAMGQMHVSLALTYRPRALVVTDLVEARLARVRDLFSARAEDRGVTLYTVNPTTADVEAFIAGLTDRRGADDVIVAAGSVRAIEMAQGYVGRGGVLNLFGGLKKGEDVVALDTGRVHYGEITVTGSSGGSPWDMMRALELVASGEIDPGVHITRVGDLDHAVPLLEMVRAREIDGRAVLYPHRRTDNILVVPFWSREDEREYLEGG